jgi:hypothetical protein
MSLENITAPIEVADNHEREKELERRILRLQLMLVERQLKTGEGKYLDLLEEYTHIVGVIWQHRYRCEFKNNQAVKEQDLDEIEKRCRQEIKNDLSSIAESFGGAERADKVFDYVQSAFLKWPASPNESTDNSVGLIRFEKVDARFFQGVPELDNGDSLMQIHFDPAYFKKDGVGAEELRTWFSKIAELIVDKYPETRAVVGRSWLFSHPIMRRLGFNKMEQKTKRMSGGAYWDQLITQEGQIDSSKVEYLEEKGKLPFDVSSGYVLVEDFVKRYLPKERAGKILLKKVDAEKRERSELMRREIEENLKKNWDSAIEQGLSADFLLDKIPSFVMVAKSLGLDGELRRFFQTCIDKRVHLKDVRENEAMKNEFAPTLSKIEKEIRDSVTCVNYEITI